MKRTLTLLVAALSLVFAMSCSKKKEPVKPAEPQSQTQGVMQQTTQAAKEAVTGAVEEIKQAFTSQIDLDKSVADLKAEAEKMDVAALTQVAGKYKDAILAKQGDLKVLTDKLAAIPMTQRLGDDAKKLTSETTQLTESIKALKDRFDVYTSAIKAKGGDVSSLKL